MIEKTFPITEKLLDKGLELSLGLHELLSKEAHTLKKRAATTDLALIANRKKETVTRLEQFAKQFAQILSTENLSMHPEDVEKYFQTARQSGLPVENAENRWQQIAALGKKCRALNDQNGAAVNLLSRHNHRLLQILRGQPQSATTYGPDGATRAERFSQPLASA